MNLKAESVYAALGLRQIDRYFCFCHLSGKMRIFLLQAGKHFDSAVVNVFLRSARRKGL